MKNRLSVLACGDCVSLDNIRCVRIVDRYTKSHVELIYSDGVIFNYSFVSMAEAEAFRNEVVTIANTFEQDVIEDKIAEKLEKQTKTDSEIPLDVKI
jgi:hypothetical protein